MHEADVAMSQSNFPIALKQYEAPPSILNDVGTTYDRLGSALLASGRVEEAVRAYRTAERLGLDTPHVHTALGQCALLQRRPGDGLAEAQAGWRENPLSAFAAVTLAKIELMLGQFENARVHLDSAIALRPDVEEYRQLREQLGP